MNERTIVVTNPHHIQTIARCSDWIGLLQAIHDLRGAFSCDGSAGNRRLLIVIGYEDFIRLRSVISRYKEAHLFLGDDDLAIDFARVRIVPSPPFTARQHPY